ncbi:hypothetical protein FF1_037861 [Malus domestica]
MEGNLTPFLLLLALLTLQLCSADASPSRSNTQYIRTSCSVTNYPRLCYKLALHLRRKNQDQPESTSTHCS